MIAWGGDGTVQRCIDVLAGTGVPLAIAPAGTANLLATHLEIPQDIEQVVAIALGDSRRTLDVGTINGEHFAVMAGAGFDAEMLKEADGGLKDTVGRVAYLWTGREAAPRDAGADEDQGRRHDLVRRRLVVRPRRQRRRGLRRRRPLRRRAARRRSCSSSAS